MDGERLLYKVLLHCLKTVAVKMFELYECFYHYILKATKYCKFLSASAKVAAEVVVVCQVIVVHILSGD